MCHVLGHDLRWRHTFRMSDQSRLKNRSFSAPDQNKPVKYHTYSAVSRSKRQLWTPPAQSNVTSLTFDIMTPLATNPLPRYHSNISRVKIHHTDMCQHAQCQRVVNCSHRGACQSGHHVPSCESSRLKRRYKRSHLKTFWKLK